MSTTNVTDADKQAASGVLRYLAVDGASASYRNANLWVAQHFAAHREAALRELISQPNVIHANLLRHNPGWEVWSSERLRKLEADAEACAAARADAERLAGELRKARHSVSKSELGWVDDVLAAHDALVATISKTDNTGLSAAGDKHDALVAGRSGFENSERKGTQ